MPRTRATTKSGVIFSRKSPATNPSAIAARAVGTTDDQTRELIGICGGAPRRVAPSDVFAELQKGKIEAAATDIMNVRERELWRVADTITNLRHSPSLLMIVINEDAWQRLTPEQQEVFTELAQDAQAYMWARFATIRAEAFAFAVSKGMRIVELPAEDTAAWRACSAPLLEAYQKNPTIEHAMEEVKGRGIPAWLSFDAAAISGRIVSMPTREQINLPVQEQLIVELYSK